MDTPGHGAEARSFASPRAHAVVLGGGFAGLLASTVLAGQGLRVTLLDADPPGPAAERNGTPQDKHPHNLLHRGAEVLRELLPGIEDDLARRGAQTYDFGERARVLFPNGWASPQSTGIEHHAVTRPLLEATIRDRVLPHPSVELVAPARCAELLWDGDRVTGVRDSTGEHRHADLVVDATGRSSRLHRWLGAAGCQPPPPWRVNAGLSYTSRLYAPEPSYTPDWRLSIELTYAPHNRTGGAANHVEDNQILVTLIGADGERPPPDEEGFLGYAASLRNQHIEEVLRHARPAGKTHCFHGLDNRWHPYHRMRDWPAGLIALGDAVCTLNPIYGHGMTVAALQAAELDRMLGDGATPSALGPAFQRAIPRVIRLPWRLAAYSDVGWRPAESTTRQALVHRTMRRVVDHVPGDPELYRRFVGVQNLMRHPATLWQALAPSGRASAPQA